MKMFPAPPSPLGLEVWQRNRVGTNSHLSHPERGPVLAGRPAQGKRAALSKCWASSDCRHLRAAENLQAASHRSREESGCAVLRTSDLQAQGCSLVVLRVSSTTSKPGVPRKNWAYSKGVQPNAEGPKDRRCRKPS